MALRKFIYFSSLLNKFVTSLSRRKFLLGTGTFVVTVLTGKHHNTAATETDRVQILADNQNELNQITILTAIKTNKPEIIAVAIADNSILAVDNLASVKNSLGSRAYTLKENFSSSELVLESTIVTSENIQFLFKNLLGNQSLNIKLIDLTISTESFVLQGKTSIFLIPDTAVEIKFYLKAKKPEMTLTVLLPNNWKFTQSFPDLGITILTRMGLKERPFLLDQIAFKQSKLIIDSVEITDLNSLLRIKFEAELPVDNDLLPLKQLIGNIQPLSVTGFIVPANEGTEVFLTTGFREKIGLGYLQVPFIELDMVAKKVDDTYGIFPPYPTAYFVLRTQLQVGDQRNPIKIPIYSKFRGLDYGLAFEANLKDLSLAGLSQLTTLLNGTDFAKFLPSNYRPEKGLILSKLGFTFSAYQKRLESLSLNIESGEPWEITKKTAMEKVFIDLLMINPSTKDRYTICNLSGDLKMNNQTRFRIGSSLPSFAVQGYMVEDSNVTLNQLVDYFAFDQVSVPEGFPDIIFSDVRIALDPQARSFSLGGRASSDWEVIPKILTIKQVATNFKVARSNNKSVVSGFIWGETAIAGAEVTLEADINDTFSLQGEISQLSLSAILEEFFVVSDLPTDLPQIELANLKVAVTPKTKAFSLAGQSANRWMIPVGINGLEVKDLNLEVKREEIAIKPTGSDSMPNSLTRQHSVMGVLAGTVNIAGTHFSTQYGFPGNFVLMGKVPSFNLLPLVQDLCGSDVMEGVPIPGNILDVSFSDVEINIAPQQKSFSLSANSKLGQVQLIVKKITNTASWGFTAGFVLDKNWRFSQIAEELKVVDGLKLSDTALVLASAADKTFSLNQVQNQAKITRIRRGLNLLGTLSLSGLGVDKLLKINSLNFYAAISGKLSDLLLEAAIDGEFPIDKGVVFGDIKFRFQPDPQNFSLALLGAITVTLNENNSLKFIGAMAVTSESAKFQATMEGVWQDPFGAKGISIANVAIDLGVNFVPPIPTIAIAGLLRIGEFDGKVAVKLSPGNLSESLLVTKFNRLYLMDVIGTFCRSEVKRAISNSFAQTVLKIGFEDVEIYIVPQATTIGEFRYEQGIRLKGKMNFWGLRAYGFMQIDYLSGIKIEGDIDEIDLAGIFKLTGAIANSKPSLYLKVSPTAIPVVNISGAVELLAIRSVTTIDLSDKGFYFRTRGSILGKFNASLEVTGNDFTKGDGFGIKATMENDLLAYLSREASKGINDLADVARRELFNAQSALQKAQDEVNLLQGKIDAIYRRIERLNQDISDKRNWFNNSRWHQKIYRWAEFSSYSGAKRAEIGWAYTEIKGLEFSKTSAWGILEGAKRTLEGLNRSSRIVDRVEQWGKDSVGSLVDVRAASFIGRLSIVNGGKVEMSVTVELLRSQQQTLTLEFNFYNPARAAEELAKRLWQDLKSLG